MSDAIITLTPAELQLAASVEVQRRVQNLASGTAPTFKLRGWIRARDGKPPEFWRDPTQGRPAFFVPAAALRPMRRAAGNEQREAA